MMAIAALTSVEAKKVKFRVDMAGQTVSQNGVSVAGNWQSAAGLGANWTPSTGGLTQEGSTTIYSRVVDLPAGNVFEFKFINDNNWGPGEEQVPAISKVESAANGGQNGNRWIYVDSLANDTMDIFYAFGQAAPAGKFAVRFAVDLKNEIVAGDGIFIAGAFTNWGAGQRKMANLFSSNSVYEFIAILDSGSYQYKFKNGDNGWESVPSGCAVSTNREVIVTTNATIPIVCFANCGACPSSKYSLFFQVDLSNSCNPYDSITVSGGGRILTDFTNGLRMTEFGSTKVFTIKVDSLNEGEVKFKFRSHKNGSTDWEDGPDRFFTLAQDDTLALTCFGSRIEGNCSPKPEPSTITFMVDVTDTIPGELFVMGTFQKPVWQAGAIRMRPTPGKPGILEATVQNVCPGSFEYKFVNAYDGDSSKKEWEEDFKNTGDTLCLTRTAIGGFNRSFTRTSTDSVSLFFKYNSCAPGAFVGLKESALSSTYKLFPNPASSYTVIEFNDKATSHSVVVMDMTGRVVKSVENYTANALTISTVELNQGIYFIKATNTRNESVTSKLIVR